MKVKKRLAGILLTFTLVLGLIPGMSMLTYADPTITWDPAEGGSVQQFTTDASSARMCSGELFKI